MLQSLLAQGTTTLDLMKLLPEGASVIAVIIVVILFLRQQKEQQKQIESIAKSFNDQIKEVTASFQAQVDRLAGEIFKNDARQQQQIQVLFDNFMNISKETIKAVIELKGAMESLSKRIDKRTGGPS